MPRGSSSASKKRLLALQPPAGCGSTATLISTGPAALGGLQTAADIPFVKDRGILLLPIDLTSPGLVDGGATRPGYPNRRIPGCEGDEGALRMR